MFCDERQVYLSQRISSRFIRELFLTSQNKYCTRNVNLGKSISRNVDFVGAEGMFESYVGGIFLVFYSI